MNRHFVSISSPAGGWLGYLTPKGTGSRGLLFAAMFDEQTARAIADDINAAGQYKAKVVYR